MEKMCFIVQFVDSKLFLLELCEMKLRQCVLCYVCYGKTFKVSVL